jgi:hypothetical protein
MRRTVRSCLLGLLPLPALAIPAPADAGSHYRYIHRDDADVYFGHISYCELKQDDLDPRIVRTEGAEAATVNAPLAPGDRILTPGGRRCEAQFDTGTIVRLDGASGLRIETLLAPALTSRENLTNLELEAGRLRVMYRDYDSSEVFQVLTPNAAVKLSRDAVVDIAIAEDGATRVWVERGRVAVLYGPKAARTQTRKVKAGETVGVLPTHQLEAVAAPASDAFTAWNRDLDERFDDLHRGRSKLPKPVYRYPPAVIHFAEKWSSAYGEWVWTDLQGYAWRPYLSRDEGWHPYMMGRWTPIRGRLFWVPQEPWGWVPYHLGQWHWDKRSGWVWYPGSLFAPAWVTWTLCDDAFTWQPFGLYDTWYWRDPYRPPGSAYYGYGRYGYAGYGGFGYGPYPSLGLPGCGYQYLPWGRQVMVAYDTSVVVPSPQPTPTPAPAPSPEPGDDRPRLPKDMRALAKQFADRVERGDPDALEAVRRVRGEPRLLERPARERAADGQTRTPGAGSDVTPGPPRAREHVGQPPPRATWMPGPTDLPSRAVRVGVGAIRGGGEGRFRDWNPDVRAAHQVGGRITYDSARNAVQCDHCRQPLVRPPWMGGGSPGSSGSSSSSSAASGTAGDGGGAAGGGLAGGANAGTRGDSGAKEKNPN